MSIRLQPGMLVVVNEQKIYLCIRECHRNDARDLMGLHRIHHLDLIWVDTPVMLMLDDDGAYTYFETMSKFYHDVIATVDDVLNVLC